MSDDRHYLGGSTCSAAAGLSHYLSPYELWRRLTGPVPEPREPSRYLYWGTVLEPVVRMHYGILHQCKVYVPPGFGCYSHPTYAWAKATPDGLVLDASDKATHGLEIKTADSMQAHRWGRAGTAKVPVEYKAQCHWYMWVTGHRRWDLVVLIGGNDYREYVIDYDEVFARKLTEACIRFWQDHVEAMVPPPRTAGHRPEPSTGEKAEQIASIRLAVNTLMARQQQLEYEIGESISLESIEALGA